MSKSKFLSDRTKYEFAQELGVADLVTTGGSLYYGNLSSRDCGNFVKMAVKRSEGSMVRAGESQV